MTTIDINQYFFIRSEALGEFESIFSEEKKILDLEAAMRIISGDRIDWARVNIQNLIVSDLNNDGLKDIVFPLWRNTDYPTLPVEGVVPNGIVIAMQKEDGQFYNATPELLGSDVYATNGVGLRGLSYDINDDGFLDLIFPSSLEDGRYATENNHKAHSSVFLSTEDGSYQMLSLGSPQWGYSAHIFDTDSGYVDVILAPFGFVESFRFVGNDFSRIGDYNWITDVFSIFLSDWMIEDNHYILTRSQDLGVKINLNKLEAGVWQSIQTVEILGAAVGKQSFVTWNGNETELDVYRIEDKFVTMLSLSESAISRDLGKVFWVLEYLELINGPVADLIYQGDDNYLKSNSTILEIDINQGGELNVNFIDSLNGGFESLFDIEDIEFGSYSGFSFIPWGTSKKPKIFIGNDLGYFEIPDYLVPPPDPSLGTVASTLDDINGDGFLDLIYWPLTGMYGLESGGISATIRYGNENLILLIQETLPVLTAGKRPQIGSQLSFDVDLFERDSECRIVGFEWLADGTVITDATSSSLTLTQEEVGKAISVRISYVDGFGVTEVVTSASTAKVANAQGTVINAALTRQEEWDIYQLSTGYFAIDRAGYDVGDPAVAPVQLKTNKFEPYTFKSEPTAVVENMDGSFDIYMPSGAGWTQQKFKANGVVSGAPVTLSPLTLLAREKTINTDLDADGFVGDWVNKVYDAGSDTERGLYKTKAGAVVIDAPLLGTQALTQSPITLKVGTALYNPKFEPSSLLEYENGSYGVMSFNGVSWTEQRFSSKGVASGGATKLNALQLVARERQFNDDIDADGFVGDWVVSVYDAGAANQRGLYKTKAGAVVIDAPLLDAQALTQTPITLKVGTALYNPKVAPSALLEYENGSYGVVTFNGVKWTEQKFTSKGFATGGAVKLSAQQLAAKERRFSEDINGDEILGDWVAEVYDAGSNEGRGLYKTMTGLLVIDAGQIGEREMTQTPITLKVGTALYNPKVAPSALLEYQNGSFGVVAFNGVSWTEQRFSTKGVALGTPVKLSMAQLLERERTFGEDIDGDDMLGDTIGSVIDNTSYISDSEQLLGLFQSSRGGAYYLDDLGQAVDDWLSSEALMLRANASKPWTPGKAQILGIAERGDGNLEVLLKSGTAYLAQTFNAETGLAMGAVQTLGAKNVAKREYYYDQDLNGTNGVELIGLEQPPANWGLI